MSKIATEAKMAQWYTEYRAFPFFAERSAEVRGRFTNLSTKILVAGCGPGYLLKELADLGYTDVWGCDASAWAKTQAAGVLSSNLASRVITADITNRTQLASLRSTAGLTGNQKFPLIITEDVLPAMDNLTEVSTALTELRRIGTTLFHIITCSDRPAERDGDFLWLTQAQWKATVGSDWMLNTETGEVITN